MLAWQTLLAATSMTAALPATEAVGIPATGPIRPRYEIQAVLDSTRSDIAGTLDLAFTNTTGRPLREVPFQLYPNNFREGSRFFRNAAIQVNTDALFHAGRDYGDLTVDQAAIDGTPAVYREAETAGFVQFERLLAPGATTSVRLRFRTHVPQIFDRFGRIKNHYSLAYWYPRLGVPTKEGWDLPWREQLFQEFHDLRADFKVKLEVPRSYTVGATGRRTALEDLPGDRKALTYEAHDVGSFAAVADPAPLPNRTGRPGSPRAGRRMRHDEAGLSRLGGGQIGIRTRTDPVHGHHLVVVDRAAGRRRVRVAGRAR